MTRRRSVTRELTGAVRQVTGRAKPKERNPWPRCAGCQHRRAPEEFCRTCGNCMGCCQRCGTCHQCPLACKGHDRDGAQR